MAPGQHVATLELQPATKDQTASPLSIHQNADAERGQQGRPPSALENCPVLLQDQ